jgi:hypothetical protein
MSRAIPCPCGHRSCKAWMVTPQAAIQGVGFTEAEAGVVAMALNVKTTDDVFRLALHMIEALPPRKTLRQWAAIKAMHAALR